MAFDLNGLPQNQNLGFCIMLVKFIIPKWVYTTRFLNFYGNELLGTLLYGDGRIDEMKRR